MQGDQGFTPTAVREPSNRLLTIGYTVALGLVALMALASHVTLNHVLHEHEGAASVINVSGRQRMLSQRIAGFAAEMALNVPGARGELLNAADEFERSHRNLILGNEALHLPPAQTPELRAIYFEGDHPLDASVKVFVARARQLADMKLDDPARVDEQAHLFAEAREPILTDLNAVVTAHQRTSEARLNMLERMQTTSLIVILMTLIVEALIIFRPMVLRIARYTRALSVMAATDYLTNTLNRRSFSERAKAEFDRAARNGRPICVLAIDADRFKSINDTYGHSGGDAVLRALALAISQNLRPSDLFARMGGEEFSILLAETPLQGGLATAQRLKTLVEALKVPFAGKLIDFTISIGVAERGDGHETLETAMSRADAALYRAKATGRNRVEAAPPSVSPMPDRNDYGSRLAQPAR
ncbi:diguanylate cyclase [Lichenihabitans sp. PAMC28606]|uniref:diguanylate cyclase n=1 Tax=Lichenihabitans sp. PAMC28606 TaxID=2880932 RepID=UPI001D0B096E|nr:diguanylate cyclase [Lichenihabitans sp. PAMC28606]UDL93278.1 diguanylate cyclase [Lichenihabitans sp. PAMC28606]